MVATGPDVAFAFGLSFAAGLSTCVGGIVLFFKCLLHLAKPATLGISLAVSAGVMIFISLAEIYGLSVKNFQKGFSVKNESEAISIENHNHTVMNDYVCDSTCKGHGWSAGSASFLVGVLIIFLLDFLVHKISPDTEEEFDPKELDVLQRKDVESAKGVSNEYVKDPMLKGSHAEGGKLNGAIIGSSSNNIDNKAVHMGNELEDKLLHKNTTTNIATQKSKKQLNRMGVLTALAVGIHNIPEGVATYIAAKSGSRLGAAMAIGIALHNIPEGIAIATPVYFATESKWKAFMWTIVAGIAEPCGSILCWLVIGESLNHIAEGVIYGIVSGMMVTISFKELIPTSLKYNANINVFIASILSGIGIMVISLILFAYAGL